MNVIKNAQFLRSNYIPEKLLYREDLVDSIKLKIKMGVGNLLLLGPPGTGKTAVTLNALNSLDKSSYIIVYINCVRENTYSSIAKKIIEQIKLTLYKEKGKSTAEVSNDLIKVLKTKRKKQVIFILDEVDKLINKDRDHQQILGVLSENISTNIILISNDVNSLKNLDARIESRISPEKRVVPPYNPGEIFNILMERSKMGLKKGSYEPITLAQISKLISKSSGDIREALNLLYELAILCEKENRKLTPELIQNAWDKVGEVDFDELFLGLPEHMKLIIASLVEGCLSHNQDFVATKNLYNLYEFLTKNSDRIPLKIRQFERLLKKLEVQRLIEIRVISPKNRRGREVVAFPKFDLRSFAKTYLPKYEAINDTALGVGEWVR